MILAAVAPGSRPELGALAAGFAVLLIGLVVLTAGRRHGHPIQSPRSTTRALVYALVYALCASSFARVLDDALLGGNASPWLFALGDVMFVTLGLLAWVMVLAEGHRYADYGLRSGPRQRMALAVLLALGPVVVVAAEPYAGLLTGQIDWTTDRMLFALLFATVGSALPEELIFRGYLMGTLGRSRRWARIALPALIFTAARSARYLPGADLPLDDWLFYVFGTALPLGLWWGLMRDWTGGSIWPGMLSHVLVAFGPTLAGASPADF